MANVDDLTHVQIIAKLENLTDEGPSGYLSPDGQQIAYILPGRHIFESRLGVVSVDGSGQKVLDEPVAGPGVEWRVRWSPNSQWIAYVRREPPESDKAKNEIWVVRPDGNEKKLLASETFVLLHGWSRDGAYVYYSLGGNELWAVNIDGQTPPSKLLHLGELAVPTHLSPDSEKVLYEIHGPSGSTSVKLGVARIDGRDNYVLTGSIEPRDYAFPNYVLSAIWSPDSTQVIYNLPTNRTHMEVLSARWNAPQDMRAIRSRDEAYYKPLSWSFDGNFIATWRYSLGTPDAEIHLIVMDLEGSLRRVYSMDPNFPLPTFVGWLDQK